VPPPGKEGRGRVPPAGVAGRAVRRHRTAGPGRRLKDNPDGLSKRHHTPPSPEQGTRAASRPRPRPRRPCFRPPSRLLACPHALLDSFNSLTEHGEGYSTPRCFTNTATALLPPPLHQSQMSPPSPPPLELRETIWRNVQLSFRTKALVRDLGLPLLLDFTSLGSTHRVPSFLIYAAISLSASLSRLTLSPCSAYLPSPILHEWS
jgi:hypothetical protein